MIPRIITCDKESYEKEHGVGSWEERQRRLRARTSSLIQFGMPSEVYENLKNCTFPHGFKYRNGESKLRKQQSMTWEYQDNSCPFPGIRVYIFAHADDIMRVETPVIFKAVWDTGAIISSISSNMVKLLGLTPVGKDWIITATGEKLHVNTYDVVVYLDDDFYILIRGAKETPLNDYDMLLGMDVIGMGDFAITNVDGKRIVSFRMPSKEVIDFKKID